MTCMIHARVQIASTHRGGEHAPAKPHREALHVVADHVALNLRRAALRRQRSQALNVQLHPPIDLRSIQNKHAGSRA